MKIAVATSTQTLSKHYKRLHIKKYVRRKTSWTDDNAVDISAHERKKKKRKRKPSCVEWTNKTGTQTEQKLTKNRLPLNKFILNCLHALCLITIAVWSTHWFVSVTLCIAFLTLIHSTTTTMTIIMRIFSLLPVDVVYLVNTLTLAAILRRKILDPYIFSMTQLTAW